MSGPVIVGNTSFSRLWRALGSIVPTSVRDLWLGPTTVIDLTLEGGQAARQPRFLRPVTVRIDPDLVLDTQITLPRSAQSDVGAAVEIMAQAQTPFAADELLIHAVPANTTAGDEELTYRVRLTPRDRIDDALRALKIRSSQVRHITVTDQGNTDFARAYGPGPRWAAATTVLPLLAVLIGLVLVSQVHLAGLRARNAGLDAASAVEVSAVAAMSSELGKREAALGAQAAVGGLFQGLPSPFLLLERIRSALPATVTVNRIRLDAGRVRIDVQAPDILAEIRALSAAMPDYAISIDGSLARTPDGTLEIGTMLLAPGAL